jgi:hypothetical protein
MRKLVILFLVLGVTSMASATYDWRGPAYTTPGTQDWFTASNWGGTPGGVPGIAAVTPTGVRTYGSANYDTSLTTCPIIANGDARALEVRVGSASPTAPAYLVMNSGTLKTTNFLMIGVDSATNGGRSGAVYMHGGTMILGGATADGLDNGSRTSGHLYVGHGTGQLTPTGFLSMDGGVIDAGGDFAIGKNNTKGQVYLSGDAIIMANELKMRPDYSEALNNLASAYMDISGLAKVILTGNETVNVGTWTGLGWITADGGDSQVQYQYFTTGQYAGKTVIGVIPEPATVCLLGLGGLSLLRRRK